MRHELVILFLRLGLISATSASAILRFPSQYVLPCHLQAPVLSGCMDQLQFYIRISQDFRSACQINNSRTMTSQPFIFFSSDSFPLIYNPTLNSLNIDVTLWLLTLAIKVTGWPYFTDNGDH